MKVLLQRVDQASVSVAESVIGEIGLGLLLLTGIAEGDTEEIITTMAKKISTLRIFPDEKGRFDKSVLDITGGVLIVSQFTLFADTSKGRRPEFFKAAKPEIAKPLCDYFAKALAKEGVQKIAQGEFGAHMKVSLVNDGPVTIMLEGK